MLLISATPSPFARKVRISMMEKGIPFEIKNEIPWHAATETPQYNPLEKLPILIPEQGEPVYESSYILDWLEHHYPTPPMLPADPADVLEAKRYDVLVSGVMDAMVLLFWESAREHQSMPWLQRQLRKVIGGLREIERRLDGRDYAVGDTFGYADIAIVSVLGMMDTVTDNGLDPKFHGIDPAYTSWRAMYPALAAYYERLHARPSVRETGPVMFELRERIV
jgi:glutathione S-transferase